MLKTLCKTLILGLLIWSQASTSAHPIVIKHFQGQARYGFGLNILTLALSKLETPYQLKTPFSDDINEARGESYVINGTLDIQFMITTAEREKNMIPIKFPIYRGTLGARLLLIKKENQQKFKSITQLDQLRQLTGGHGEHWKDLKVYEHNGLPVSTNVEYLSLFKQLKTGRFDYFHRGLYEIWGELHSHSNELMIADDIMLFYLQPTYFFVSKKRPELAKQIQAGLNRALQDGSYKALFLQHLGTAIKQAQLHKRTLIMLDNPDLPANTQMIDMSWWLPKSMQSQIRNHYQ